LTAPGGHWRVERQRASAAELHAGSTTLAAEVGGGRQIRLLEVDGPALILGSSQPEADVDLDAAAAAGVEVARRRSGGGAVLLGARVAAWVDVIIPTADPLWDADVRRASWWLGDVWATALEVAGAGPAQVWRGGIRTNSWSGRVCFAGLGPGEVCLGGQKVVGISQRRTRHATLFQTAVLLAWDPSGLLGLLQLDDAVRARGIAELAPVATGIGPDRAAAVVAAVLDALPGRSG
jgi:lipoate-protein ligase A